MRYANRTEAGRKPALRLEEYTGVEGLIVLGLPRGGVLVRPAWHGAGRVVLRIPAPGAFGTRVALCPSVSCMLQPRTRTSISRRENGNYGNRKCHQRL